MEWSDENSLKMIDIYKKKALLWDPKHKDHFRKNLKEDAWREISAEMNIRTDQCKKKMICLLASNRREKNKIKSSKGTGTGRDEIYVSKWFAYEAFKFLEDRDVPRCGLTTEAEKIHGNEEDIDADVTATEQREQETTASSSAPKPSKRMKGKGDDICSSMMKNAFDIIETAAKKLNKEPSQPNDEIDSFFTYVAAKVHKYSHQTQTAVQHAVFEILMKADTGSFDWPTPSYQYSSNWQNPAESRPNPPMYCQPYFSQPQQTVPLLTIHSPSEPSLSSISTEKSPAPSTSSENFEDYV